MDDTDVIIVTAEEAGMRLDKILALRFQEGFSRTYFQWLIEEQKVLLNGEIVKKRIMPAVGDEIEIQFVCLPQPSLIPEAIPLDIIFEDESLIVINKPAGMVVHPAAGNWSGTFVNALLYHCREAASLVELSTAHNSFRPGIVHRLDKDTTGLLVAAKSAKAHEKLAALFFNREIHKEYLAICIGNPGNVNIEAPIGRNPSCYRKMAVVREGKKALSQCKTLAYNGKLALVSIILVTGRTHQIRVHLQSVNTPVLGDCLYGNLKINKSYKVDRQMLHAHRLEFIHPITQQELKFEAPLPKEMNAISKNIFL